MAGIIEGPFRYIVMVPSPGGLERGMTDILVPLRRNFYVQVDVKTFNSGGFFQTIDDTEYPPLRESTPYPGIITSQFVGEQGAYYWVEFVVPNADIYVRPWIGQRISVNGTPVAPLGVSVLPNTPVAGQARMTFMVPMAKVPGLSADLQLTMIGFEDLDRVLWEPKTTSTSQSGDYYTLRPIADAVVASWPAELNWPMGDLTFFPLRWREVQESETSAPSYFRKDGYLTLPLAAEETGLYWVVGKLRPKVLPDVGYTCRADLVFDSAGGRVPFLDSGLGAGVKPGYLGATAFSATFQSGSTDNGADVIGFRSFARGSNVVFEITFDDGSTEEVLEFNPTTAPTSGYPLMVRGTMTVTSIIPAPGQTSNEYTAEGIRFTEYPCLAIGTIS